MKTSQHVTASGVVTAKPGDQVHQGDEIARLVDSGKELCSQWKQDQVSLNTVGGRQQ